jgi:hypothetical protein
MPVVMISGFRYPTKEFQTVCRASDGHAGNGRGNDRFDHHHLL